MESHVAGDDAAPRRLAGRRRRLQRGRLPHLSAAQRRRARAEALRPRGHGERSETSADILPHG